MRVRADTRGATVGETNPIPQHRQRGRLRGLRFALMTIVVATLGVIWMLNGKSLHALAAAGIVANCICVIGLGARAWRAGERGSSLRLLFSSAHRNSLSKEHPRMSEDTLVIGQATLIPLGLTAFALVDLMTAEPH